MSAIASTCTTFAVYDSKFEPEAMVMSVRHLLSLVAGLGLVYHLSGCSADPNMPKLGKVSGKVSYQGKPVDAGRVVFTPVAGKGGESDQGASGEISSDGSYEMTTFNTGDGAVLGQHIVTVVVRKGEMPKPDADGHRQDYPMLTDHREVNSIPSS